eukprot:SAG31_NODE_562_length_14085_cov_164.582869_6_plen_84_part_00
MHHVSSEIIFASKAVSPRPARSATAQRQADAKRQALAQKHAAARAELEAQMDDLHDEFERIAAADMIDGTVSKPYIIFAVILH